MNARSSLPPIPVFHLYGEAEGRGWASAETAFVHIETIASRASLHDWQIRPHRHADLYQCLLILKGGGRFGADGVERAFRAPAMLGVPPTWVHGFAFEPQTEGYVLTLSHAFLEQGLGGGARRAVAPLWPLFAPIESERDLAMLTSAFEGLDQEFHRPAPGWDTAIAAYLALILIAADRLAAEREPPERGQGRDGRLLEALRVLIHVHAAEGWGVEDYARALAVTSGRLTAACRRAAGRSPMQLVHDQLMIEAKRNLIYTDLSVQEIGYALGFADPAYFSRFFSRRQGVSPQRFREARGASAGR
jgi:AraC family transcriptional activator of pobA